MITREAVAYDDAPKIVMWELTRACALACKHCRAEAIPYRNPGELTTKEAYALIDEIAPVRPLLVFTGGDPLMRDDIYKLVERATAKGLRAAVSPSATGRLTKAAIDKLARAGCKRISLSIDAPDAERHDAFRGVRGSFERTLEAARYAPTVGIEVQINTSISRYNHGWLDEFEQLLAELPVVLWSVFLVVPVGRAKLSDCLDSGETETLFRGLYRISQRAKFDIKTTEAPHYRRFVAQRLSMAPDRERPSGRDEAALRLPSIGDGRGFVFVSHDGDVFPSGFLPFKVGNVREKPLMQLYRDDELMRRLRRPDTFGGKCGVCEFRRMCGGSRARAYAFAGDPFAEDPACSYLPRGL